MTPKPPFEEDMPIVLTPVEVRAVGEACGAFKGDAALLIVARGGVLHVARIVEGRAKGSVSASLIDAIRNASLWVSLNTARLPADPSPN